MPDLNIVLAGAAGQGVQSAAAILGKTLLRLGFFVYTTQDYQSRVRGGHNFMRVRFSDQPMSAQVRSTNYLLALNEESLDIHLPNMLEDGLAFCMVEDKGEKTDPHIRALPKSVGPDAASGAKFVAVKLLSMLFTTLGYSPETLATAVNTHFGKRLKPELLKANLDAIEDVAGFVDKKDVHPLSFKPDPTESRMLVSGNEAIAMGMIAAGVGVYAGYPMTPSTSVMTELAKVGPKLGIVVEQTEDEIASLNAAIGASYAGARAACGTSGAGICLMSEAVGLAGMTETPVVILAAQRPGPAVGMATRTEQSDLLFICHASQGEFPRAVISPAFHSCGFYMTAHAFNLAEKWHIPVFVMDDQAYADSQYTTREFDLTQVSIDRGPIAEEPDEMTVLERYQLTDTGVSPRAIPTLSKWLIACDSHEHDEVGHLTDNPDNRNRQMDKRMRKLNGIASEFPGPQIWPEPAEDMIICWGSTSGPVVEAIGALREQGKDISVAIFRYLFPVPVEKVHEALDGAKRLFTFEMNATGQLGKLLRMEAGITTEKHIGKVDGRALTVEEAIEMIEKALYEGGDQ
jgi:2-oxoglutarate/2-oxoacid ferredoxin oxidoreductase subunit alpha